MRVLIVHNYYRSTLPSGENRVVDNEIEALRAAGAHVSTFLRSSDEIPEMSTMVKAQLAVGPLHAGGSARAVGEIIRRERPDVMHLHNPYPLVSWGVVTEAGRQGVPVVQTVHNHRHVCMKGTFQRDGHDCRDCFGKTVGWPGVLHSCYRDSRVQSVIMAGALVAGRRARDQVARFIALTPAIRQSLVSAGVEPQKVVLKPNSVPDPGPLGPSGSGFLFVGRLSAEKGVLLLADAWERHPVGSLGTLTYVGDGPEAVALRERARTRPDLHLSGPLPEAGVRDAMRSAAAVLVPSVWPEAMPLTVIEAMAAGRAVLVSDVGGLPRVVDSSFGMVIAPTVEAWSEALARTDATDLVAKGQAAREAYLRSYTPEIVTQQLISIYESVRQP